jgi:hypothetical protein
VSRPDWLAAHPECAFIEGLLAVVQADDAVTEEETTLLGGLLDAYGVGGTDAEREAWFHGRVDPAAVADDLRDPLARRFLLDRAFLLAGADGHLADAERARAVVHLMGPPPDEERRAREANNDRASDDEGQDTQGELEPPAVPAVGPNGEPTACEVPGDAGDWHPILDYTLNDVWSAIRSAGQKPHRIYSEGWSRLSCVMCVLGRKSEHLLAKAKYPDKFQKMADLEKELNKSIRISKAKKQITNKWLADLR